MQNTYDLSHCALCPRACGADRTSTAGRCGAGTRVKAARAALHFWEEPCISGARGAGTVFFSGCPLGCVYCQNREIASGEKGVEITVERLAQIYLELQEKGAHNVELVTPDCYAPEAARAIDLARADGLKLPVVCNCSGYESDAIIDALGERVDVWMPDFKYFSPDAAAKYSRAPDYPEVARHALERMVALRPECVFDGDGMMRKGVLVRHMTLPCALEDSKAVLAYLYGRYGDSIWYSIMSQYTPVGEPPFPELRAPVKRADYDDLVEYALALGIENAFIQEGGAVSESFIPDFDGEGILVQ